MPCRTVAYRDYYDVMGVSWGQMGSLNAPQAARIKLLPASQIQSLTVQGAAATTTLAPLAGGTGTRALRLTDAEGVGYWMEYRTATGRDAWLGTGRPPRAGLRRAPAPGRPLPDTSVLLDGTPAAATGWDADFQAALPIGTAVPCPGGDFSVVVQSVSAAGAVVTVTPTAPAGGVAVAPSAPVEAAPGEVMSGTGAAPSVAASPGAAPPVGGAAPIALQAPGFDGRALGTTHALESVADSSTDSGFLVAAAAAVLLPAATLLARPPAAAGGRARADRRVPRRGPRSGAVRGR